MTINTENGMPNISYANVLNLMDLHGKIIGVIHAIVPFFEKQGKGKEQNKTIKHITNFYFANGFVHTAMGLAIGCKDESDEDQMVKISGLQALLYLLPGFAPMATTEFLMDLGTDELTKSILENKRPAFFIFRIPTHSRAGNIMSCTGNTALMNAIELMEEEIEGTKKSIPEEIRMFGADDE